MPKRIEHKVIDGRECKWCYKCEKYLPLEFFPKSKREWDGLHKLCRGCSKEYRQRNKYRISLYQKSYHKKNKEKIAFYHKSYQKKNKDKIAVREKSWRKKNRDRIASRAKSYYCRNKDKIALCNEKNRKKRRESGESAAYQRNRLKTDKKYALRHRLRTNLYNWIKRKGGSKKHRTHEYLGCTYDFFMEYLKSKFVEGMSFENRNEWHIDHIVPVTAFDCLDDVQVKIASYYKNLQPLWARDNILKGNKYREEDKIALINLFNKDHSTNYMTDYLENYNKNKNSN